MVKSFRFLLRFAAVNLAAVLVFAAVVIGGCYATGVPGGADNLFRTYFTLFPLMTLFILFFYGFALCTNSLNLALSLGARRRDFFWGMQGILVVYAGVCWPLQLLMAALPRAGNWAERTGFDVNMMGFDLPLGVFPLLCVLVLVLAASWGW